MSIADGINNILENDDDMVKHESIATFFIHSLRTNTKSIDAFCRELCNDMIPPSLSKKVFLQVARELKFLFQGEEFWNIAAVFLQKFRQQGGAFDEAEYIIREDLFSSYSQNNAWCDAAASLAGMNFLSPTKSFTDSQRVDVYIRIAEAYLMSDESGNAENFVNKASPLVDAINRAYLFSKFSKSASRSQTEQPTPDKLPDAVLLRFRTAMARVLDANQKFLEAAVRYHSLSTSDKSLIDEFDLMTLYAKSISCAVLGRASAEQYRIISLLYHDERLSSLSSISSYQEHANIVEKMYRKHVIRSSETTIFEKSLEPHQKALVTADLNVFKRSIMEHNFQAISIIYDNISISEMSILLEQGQEACEEYCASMIRDGRLSKALIDQSKMIIRFREGYCENVDDVILNICLELDCVCEQISKK